MGIGRGISIAFIVFLIFAAVFIAIPIAIGVYVYRDANKRGMNALMWTLVSALAPGFVGLIIYLVVRTEHTGARCSLCGEKVLPSFVVCPHCGTGLKPTCTECGFPLEFDYNVCPGCGTPVTDENRGGVVYGNGFSNKETFEKHRDKGLIGVLSAVILIPIALILVIVGLNAMIFRNTVNVDYGYVTMEPETVPIYGYVTMEPETVPIAEGTLAVNLRFEDVMPDIVMCEAHVTSGSNDFIEISRYAVNAPGMLTVSQHYIDYIGDATITIHFLDSYGNYIFSTEEFYIHDLPYEILIYHDNGNYTFKEVY